MPVGPPESVNAPLPVDVGETLVIRVPLRYTLYAEAPLTADQDRFTMAPLEYVVVPTPAKPVGAVRVDVPVEELVVEVLAAVVC